MKRAVFLLAVGLLSIPVVGQDKSIPATPLIVPKQAPSPKDLPNAPKLLSPGQKAPNFTVDRANGGTLEFAFARKNKVVILDFWATWCGPCLMAMPHLQEIWEKVKNRGDVSVLAVCTSDDRPKFDTWVAANKGKYTLPFFYDPAGRDNAKKISRNLYGVVGIPTTFVISKDGTVVDAIVGYEEGDKRLETALAKAGVTL